MVIGTALTATGTTSAEETWPTPTTDVNGEEIHDVTRYCHVCWRNARLPSDAWADCTQQVLARLLQTVPPGQWTLMLKSEGDEKREFLRAIDAVKKRTQRTRKPGDLTADVADSRHRTMTSVREQWEAVNVAAAAVLSERQKRIVELSANGWAVPDIAAELGTTTERVSDEKYKAIRKLRVHLGVDG